MREYFGGVARGPGKGSEQPRRPAAQPAGRFDFEATVQRARGIMEADKALTDVNEKIRILKEAGGELGDELERLQQEKASWEERLWTMKHPYAPPKGH